MIETRFRECPIYAAINPTSKPYFSEWFTVEECNTNAIAEWMGVDTVEFFENYRCDIKVDDVLPGRGFIFARAT